MKISRQVPETVTQLVEYRKRDKMCRWYEITPRILGELQNTNTQTWVTDDGLTFRAPDDALEYFRRREREQGRAIEPGTYSLPIASVTQDRGSLVLRLHGGDEIVIKYQEPAAPKKRAK